MVLGYLTGLISSKVKTDENTKKENKIDKVKQLCDEELPNKSKNIGANISAEWKDLSDLNKTDVTSLDNAMKEWALDKIEALRDDKKELEDRLDKIKQTIKQSHTTDLPSSTELKIMQIVNSNPIQAFTGKESVTNLLFYFHQTAETYFSKYRIQDLETKSQILNDSFRESPELLQNFKRLKTLENFQKCIESKENASKKLIQFYHLIALYIAKDTSVREIPKRQDNQSITNFLEKWCLTKKYHADDESRIGLEILQQIFTDSSILCVPSFVMFKFREEFSLKVHCQENITIQALTDFGLKMDSWFLKEDQWAEPRPLISALEADKDKTENFHKISWNLQKTLFFMTHKHQLLDGYWYLQKPAKK